MLQLIFCVNPLLDLGNQLTYKLFGRDLQSLKVKWNMSATNAVFAMPGSKQNGYRYGVGKRENRCSHFQMPLQYPRYKKSDYETMPEWKLDCLLKEYGLPVIGDVNQKRKFAMGAFLWPSRNDEE
ncbi:Cytoplasmic tRNA 2-thiolation protein 1 [Melia azedarach]|uniref:Cytoplasmic tRNA 2-thiolation protein 1 n=1 Tax=Melia azedarach TaxID=155640 RepID=A0ACC1XKV7_MELAZ|nr:Cytoplasmic tRNA 2-thiolation protein 1 [Melia azedarach]